MLTISDLQLVLPHSRKLISYPPISLERGARLLIQGSSGRGKSLLLQYLAGILSPGITVLGSVEIPSEIRPVWVPPEPSRILPPGLRLGQHLHSLDLKPSRVEKLLYHFSSVRRIPPDWRKRYPDELSGGELQRLALAFLLSRRGTLWLVDEPSIGLDSELRKLLPGMLEEILAEDPSSILIAASHDANLLGTMNGVIKLDLDKQEFPSERLAFKNDKRSQHSLLEAHGLAIGVPRSRKWLLENLSVDLVPGRIHWMRGKSGSGKTLLARTLLRLSLRDRGSILWRSNQPFVDLWLLQKRAGQSDTQKMRKIRPELGWVPQDSRQSFIPGKPVGRQMEHAADVQLLERLCLKQEHLSCSHTTLSSGELKRMDLYRVLLSKPRLLILDEPFAQLDRQNRLQVLDAVRDWAKRGRCAVLLYSHEKPEENMADSVQDIEDR